MVVLIPSVEFRLRYSVASSICFSIVSLRMTICYSEDFTRIFNSIRFNGHHLPVVRLTSSVCYVYSRQQKPLPLSTTNTFVCTRTRCRPSDSPDLPTINRPAINSVSATNSFTQRDCNNWVPRSVKEKNFVIIE